MSTATKDMRSLDELLATCDGTRSSDFDEYDAAAIELERRAREVNELMLTVQHLFDKVPPEACRQVLAGLVNSYISIMHPAVLAEYMPEDAEE